MSEAKQLKIDELRRALRDAVDIVTRLDLDGRFIARVAGWRDLARSAEKAR